MKLIDKTTNEEYEVTGTVNVLMTAVSYLVGEETRTVLLPESLSNDEFEITQ